MLSRTLIIRADASTKIGSGHLMRCIALAQFYRSNIGKVIFITRCNNDALVTRILENGFQVIRLERAYPDPEDLEAMSKILYDNSDSWVVLDGYHFDSAYQLHLKEKGCRLLVIDDMNHLDHYYADIVLNQNINAEKISYSCEQDSCLLLGTHYVLLRNEFLTNNGIKSKTPSTAHNLIVTLGGSDPINVTRPIIQALNKLKISNLHVKVIAGASHPQISSLHKEAKSSPFQIDILYNIQDMTELMTWADLAVSAGGTTCYELAFMGIPFVVIILSKNQEKIAEGLHFASAAINLGWHFSVTLDVFAKTLLFMIDNKEKRTELISNGKKLVDGFGVTRVLSQMMISL